MRRRFRSIIHIVAGCAIVPSTALLAQSPSESRMAAIATAHWCFRGRPKPACDNFLLTEFGLAKKVNNAASLATWELGGMVNRGTRGAVGIGVFFQDRVWTEEGPFGFTRNEMGVGIRPRFRLWMTPDISVDLAPGIILFGSGAGVGFSGHVDLNIQDIAALTAHVVSRPHAYGFPSEQHGVFIGGRVGSKLGAIIGGLTLAYLAVLATGPDT